MCSCTYCGNQPQALSGLTGQAPAHLPLVSPLCPGQTPSPPADARAHRTQARSLPAIGVASMPQKVHILPDGTRRGHQSQSSLQGGQQTLLARGSHTKPIAQACRDRGGHNTTACPPHPVTDAVGDHGPETSVSLHAAHLTHSLFVFCDVGSRTTSAAGPGQGRCATMGNVRLEPPASAPPSSAPCMVGVTPVRRPRPPPAGCFRHHGCSDGRAYGGHMPQKHSAHERASGRVGEEPGAVPAPAPSLSCPSVPSSLGVQSPPGLLGQWDVPVAQ